MRFKLTVRLLPLLLASPSAALSAAKVTKESPRLYEAPPAFTTVGWEHCVTGELTRLHNHHV